MALDKPNLLRPEGIHEHRGVAVDDRPELYWPGSSSASVSDRGLEQVACAVELVAHGRVLETAALLDDAHVSIKVPVGFLGSREELGTRTEELLLLGVRAVRTFPGNGLEDLVEVRVAEQREVVLVARAAGGSQAKVLEGARVFHHFHPIRDSHLAVLELAVTPKTPGQLYRARGYRVQREQLFRYGHDGPCRPVSAHRRAPSFVSCVKPFRQIFVWYRIRATGQAWRTASGPEWRSATVTEPARSARRHWA